MAKYILIAVLITASFLGCGGKDERILKRVKSPTSGGVLDKTQGKKIYSDGTEKRVAFIIGNGNYDNVTNLDNPVNDAQDIKSKLQTLGFDKIIYVENGSLQTMNEKLYEFENEFGENTVAFFYFAGHGVEYNGHNFLVASNSNVKKKTDLKYNTFSFSRVLSGFDDSKNRLNIAVLDACRDNPFRNLRDLGTGLASAGATGTYIAYATAPGNTAHDGNGRNGLFTKHLLEHLGTEDSGLDDTFDAVATAVSSESGGEQVPWTTRWRFLF